MKNAIKSFIQNRNEAESKSLVIAQLTARGCNMTADVQLSNMEETSAVKRRDTDASAELSSYTRELLLVMVCMVTTLEG